MTSNQINYAKHLEDVRSHKASELNAQRANDISAEQARIAFINAGVNQQNADTNARNADTNVENARINLLNANTNARNADTNAFNAETNARNADTNAFNADVNAQNAQTRREELALGYESLYEQQRSNQAREQETRLHNQAVESQALREFYQQQSQYDRSQMETERHNVASESNAAIQATAAKWNSLIGAGTSLFSTAGKSIPALIGLFG